MRNWSSLLGPGNTRYGPETAGIPASEPLWEYNETTEGPGPVLGCYVIYDDRLLFLGEDWTGSINTQTGESEWLVERETSRPHAINTNGRYFVVEPLLICAQSGETVLDYSRDTGYTATKKSRPASNRYYMAKTWTDGTVESGLLIINLDDLSIRHVEKNYSYPQLLGDTSQALVATAGGIARIDLEDGRVIWESGAGTREPLQGAVIAIFDKTATLLTREGRRSVHDLETGEVITSFNYSDISKKLTAAYYPYAHTEKHFYVSGAGHYRDHLVAYDYINGSILFDKHIPNLHHSFCIAGDLLFLIHDVVPTRSESELIALDRFTGEQVWAASTLMVAAYDAKACGDKVFFSSVTGHLRCYQWKDIYISSARERFGLKVVK